MSFYSVNGFSEVEWALAQLGSNPALYFVPWNCFRFAGVKFIDAASYFLVPGEYITVFVSHA